MTAVLEEDDPLAPASTQFALEGATAALGSGDVASPVGVRPWMLRDTRPAAAGRVLPPWRYDPQRQVAVEIGSGVPLIWTAGPTATTTASTDGEDGPSAEDWIND